MVAIEAPSASRASVAAAPSSRESSTALGYDISAAAFSVNVMARIDLDGGAVVHHGAHEALHQHGGLAGAGAGADQEGAVAAVDGLAARG